MDHTGSANDNSPPHPLAPGILEQLLDRTRQPLLSELKYNWRCHICHDPWMTGETPELPIKLACGHIVGAGCIMRWLNPLSGQGSNSCSVCRAPIMSSWNPNDFRAATAPPIPARPFYPDDQDLALLLHSMQVNDHDDGALTVTLPTVHTPAEDIANNVIRRPAAEVEESYAGAATMFDTAEAENAERERLRQERNLAERRRRLWLQFVEGVVREVEMASDQRSQQLAPVAREIIDLRGLETFLEVRRLDGESARRILRTFPRLHTELVLRLGSFRPIPNISIESYLRVEHNLGQNVDFANLHAACWSIRLFERVIQESPAEAELGDEIFDVTTGARMVQGEDHGESFNHTGAIESLTRHSTRNLDGPTVRVPTSRSDSDTTVGILSADSGTFSEHGAALAGLRDDGLRAEEMRREREIEDCLGVEEAALGFGRSSERRVATRQRG